MGTLESHLAPWRADRHCATTASSARRAMTQSLSRSSDSERSLTPRQAHLIGTLRRSREDWLELWELSQRAGYTVKITAANVRELRRRGVIITRPMWNGLSTIEVSL